MMFFSSKHIPGAIVTVICFLRYHRYVTAVALSPENMFLRGDKSSYYGRVKCLGTGDCLLSLTYLSGGFSNPYDRWLIECHDGEAIVGIYDTVYAFTGIVQIWCKFMFPYKPPSRGIYPYYSGCNARNQTLKEYYCYDKFWPYDTVHTFVTALYNKEYSTAGKPSLIKCCKTPPGYYLDYNRQAKLHYSIHMRCEWKYTHDKYGEHYDGFWVVKCETGQVMTGLGQAKNPLDGKMHYVWIQCCPVVFGGERISDVRPAQPYENFV